MAQCYNKTQATLAQSKASIINAVLDVGSLKKHING